MLAVIAEAVRQSTVPVDVIAEHARLRTKDLDAYLDGSRSLEVYTAGRILVAAEAHTVMVIMPEELNSIVNPLSQPRRPLQHRQRETGGRVSMVDRHRSTAQGNADIDGMLFSMHVTSVCHNLITHLFKDKYEDDPVAFEKEQSHWVDLFDGARDATFEDLNTLVALAGGEVRFALIKEDQS